MMIALKQQQHLLALMVLLSGGVQALKLPPNLQLQRQSQVPDVRAPRLYLDADLHTGALLPLTEEHTHYLATVMRLRDGSPVRVFNGKQGEHLCSLSQPSGGGSPGGSPSKGKGKRASKAGPLQLQVGPLTRAQEHDACARHDVWLLCAPLRRARLKVLVEKATELGVSCIAPALTAHTQEPLDAEGVNRLLPVAIEAAEQCERLSLPTLSPPTTLPDLLSTWRTAPATARRTLFICQERSPEAPPVLAALSAAAERSKVLGPVAFLIGPEGGFSEEEQELLSNLEWARRVSLGPTVLRAETAALYALACYSAFVAGDGDGGGGGAAT